MQKILSLNKFENTRSSSIPERPKYFSYNHYECKECNLKFSNLNELNNHKSKFCTLSYYQPPLYTSQKINFREKNRINSLKDQLKSSDDEYLELQKQVFHKHIKSISSSAETEMYNNLKNLKQRMHINSEDPIINDLFNDIDNKKNKENIYQTDLLMIQKELKNYEKKFVNMREMEIKKGLESLLNLRESLKSRESDYLWEVERFKDVFIQSENMRLEGSGNLDSKFIEERKKKMQTLNIMRNKLENERLYLLEDFQKLQNKEIIRRNNAGISAANSILVDGNIPYNDVVFMAGKIEDDAKKIYNMKKEFYKQGNGSNLIAFDPDQSSNQRDQKSFHEHLEYVLESNDKLKNLQEKAEKLSVIRENIERFGLEKGLEKTRVKLHFRADNDKLLQNFNSSIQDIQRLKKEYIESGGSDPDFLINLDNLQSFYNQYKPTHFDPNPDPMITKAFMQTEKNNDNNFWDTLNLTQTERSFLNKTDFENKNLKKTMMEFEFNASKLDNTMKKTNTNLTELQMKMSGLDPALERSFRSKKAVFLKDNMELDTEEEKLLKKIVTEEGDALRNLAKLPLDSELYYKKLVEMQPLINYRIELEKIVQEQRFARQREDYPGYSEELLEEKKKKIAERLRRNFESLRKDRRYDIFEGLVVHWDFLLSLPKKYEQIRLTFGVFCKGETYYAPRLIEDHRCEAEDYNRNKCMIGEKDHIYDIPANKDTIMVIEMQCLYSDNKKKKCDIFGWTMLELFDMKGDLMRGKFKIPFYSTKTNPNLLVDELQNLIAVSNTLLYLRISFPQDAEYGHDEVLIPEKLADEYFVPFIHRKTILKPKMEEPAPDDLNITGRWLPKAGNWAKMPPSRLDFNRSQEEEQIYPVPKIDDLSNLEPEKQVLKQGPIRKGIYLKINGIKNLALTNNIKIRVALVDNLTILKDEKEQFCSFETELYSLPESENPEIKKYIENINKNEASSMLNKQNQKIDDSQSKENTNTYELNFLEMNEEYIFVLDIYYYCELNNAYPNIYLVFQVLCEEKEEEDPEKHVVDRELEDARKPKEYTGYCWLAFQCFENKKLNVGRHFEHLNSPPMIKPPFDEEIIKQGDVLDFIIQEYVYDINQIDDVFERLRLKRIQHKKKNEKNKKKNKRDLWADMPLDQRPFIENLKRQYHDRPFEKGYGIDFYIDGARFLPDNVTVTKVVLFVMNQNTDRMITAQAGLPDLESFSYSPMFSFRQELRAPHFDPTLLALISMETIDQANKEVRIIGYSAINFFLSRSTRKQPVIDTDSDIILMDGKYQLPIYCQEPIRKKPFNMERMIKLDRIPCASLLVRIQLAPMTDDGLRPLSLNEVAQKDWEKKKLWLPAPPYGLGEYNTSLCSLRDSEKDLFFTRQKRGDTLVKENAIKMMNYEGITEEITHAKMKDWMDKRIKRTNNTEIIDMIYFAKYQASTGFKFSLDGYHNSAVSNLPLIGLYCLNPPAALFAPAIVDPNSILLNSNFDWDSPLQSPKYNEGFFTWRDQQFDKYLNIIIDIRSVLLSERMDKVKIEPVGWTIVPVYTPNGYVRSGIYQIPVFKGPVNKSILPELTKNDPWEYLMNEKKNKKNKIEYLETMSCVVRLVDAQREGHFQFPFDYTRMSYIYLPKGKAGSYTYNAAVEQRLKNTKKLISLAPNKFKTNEFNDNITQAVVQNLGIKHFNKEK